MTFSSFYFEQNAEKLIDKDEYARSNFEEKMSKREESMNEENHQIINEEPKVDQIVQKLIQMETLKKLLL